MVAEELMVGMVETDEHWSNWAEPMAEASSEVETAHKFPDGVPCHFGMI